MLTTTDALNHRWRCNRGLGAVLPFNRSVRHREAFDIRRCPGVFLPPRLDNLPKRQQFLIATQPDYQPLSYLPAHHDFCHFLPPLCLPPSNHPTRSNHVSPRPPNNPPPCPLRTPPPLYPPLTCARAYPRRAHTNHLRPDRILPHFQRQHGQ